MITKLDAIISLVPGAEVSVRDGVVEWHIPSIPPVNDEQIVLEQVRLQEEYNRREYQRLRAPEYPSIGDQLDALWKGGDAAAEMLAQVQAVKAKYPKPEGL